MPGSVRNDDPEAQQESIWNGTWLRPKNNLTQTELSVLLAIAIAPVVVVMIRISAFPDVLGPGFTGSFLPAIGHDLNMMLSLESVPASERSRVLYMLFLPTSAMLIALARLTFGIRVIGFRAILISVGFQESGIVPSLILILVVVAIVVGLRPALKRIQLPSTARLSVILCIAVVVLLSALLAAPWVRSDVLWGVAFFPVIVLGLLAESIAKTLDRDSGLTAAWRTGMTIGVALILAGVSQIAFLGEILIQFPELVVSQTVSIILISEYLDLRLFQDWDSKLSGLAVPRLFGSSDSLRIAVIRNQRRNGILARMGSPSPGGYDRASMRRIVASLREKGHAVKIMEGDMRLLAKLGTFLPPHPRTGQPGGIALNLAHGIQGAAPSAHVPAMLEMAGIAFTGPTSHGHILAVDKVVASDLMIQWGVPVPHRYGVDVISANEIEGHIVYPVVVKPRHALRYKLRIAKNSIELDEAIRAVTRAHRQPAVVERFIAGREIEVPILGNVDVECLPFVELQPGKQEKSCPASLDPAIAEEIRVAALAAYHACGCRDFALINLRISNAGKPYVIDADSTSGLEIGGSFELAAEAAELSFAELMDQIIVIARERYRTGESISTPQAVRTPESGIREEKGRSSLAG
jgi:D-alanine-D-alanine ligase